MNILKMIFFGWSIIMISTCSAEKSMDAQSQAFLDRFKGLNAPGLDSMSIEEARSFVDTFVWTSPIQVKSIQNIKIPGPHGDIPLRIYSPQGTGPFPVLVFLHGGGWALGSLDLYDPVCRYLCDKAKVVVVAVDYHLAPEYKFPKPLEDSYTALNWTVNNISNYGGDAHRLAVGGDSAGGNLTAALTLMAKDKNGPKISYQLLIYPITNYNFDTESYKKFAEGYLLDRKEMIHYWNLYLNNADEGKKPYASPLQAQDLSHLPPALIVLADFDPLSSEGRQYAEKLQKAGVPVTVSEYPTFHGFIGMYNQIDLGRKALDDISMHLNQSLK